MAIELDTSSVAPQERLRFWREGLHKLLDVDASIEGPLASPLGMHLTVRKLGSSRLVELEGAQPIRSSVQGREGVDRVIILCQIYGSGYIVQDGVSHFCGPGSICVYRARNRTLAWATPYRHVSLHVPAERFREIFPGEAPTGVISVRPDFGPGIIFADLLQSLVRNCEALDSATGARIEDSTLRIFAAVLAGQVPKHQTLPAPLKEANKSRIRSFVREHLRDPGLDITAVAHAVGLSPRYVHELFADEPVPLMKWVWTERLRGVHHDLGSGEFRNHTISGIAYRWGFSSSAHFSRAFHAQYEMTPSQFRRQASGEHARDSGDSRDRARPIREARGS